MLKRRQNEVKRNIFLFDEVKKNIAGRIPETTRSENLFNRHPTTHQKKLAPTNLRLSPNQTIKQKVKTKKSNLLNSEKI